MLSSGSVIDVFKYDSLSNDISQYNNLSSQFLNGFESVNKLPIRKDSDLYFSKDDISNEMSMKNSLSKTPSALDTEHKLSGSNSAGSFSSTEEWQTQFFRTKLCPYHMEGCCANGFSCRFAHNDDEVRPLPNLKCTKLCDSYLRGDCCKMKNCSFAHSPSQLRISNSSFYKVTLCNFYKKGRCWNGAHCRFAHGVTELQRDTTNTQLTDKHKNNVPFFQLNDPNSNKPLKSGEYKMSSSDCKHSGCDEVIDIIPNYKVPVDPIQNSADDTHDPHWSNKYSKKHICNSSLINKNVISHIPQQHLTSETEIYGNSKKMYHTMLPSNLNPSRYDRNLETSNTTPNIDSCLDNEKTPNIIHDHFSDQSYFNESPDTELKSLLWSKKSFSDNVEDLSSIIDFLDVFDKSDMIQNTGIPLMSVNEKKNTHLLNKMNSTTEIEASKNHHELSTIINDRHSNNDRDVKTFLESLNLRLNSTNEDPSLYNLSNTINKDNTSDLFPVNVTNIEDTTPSHTLNNRENLNVKYLDSHNRNIIKHSDNNSEKLLSQSLISNRDNLNIPLHNNSSRYTFDHYSNPTVTFPSTNVDFLSGQPIDTNVRKYKQSVHIPWW